MTEKFSKTFKQKSLGFADFSQLRGTDSVKTAEIHRDGRRHLMTEDGREFLGPPETPPLFAGRQERRESFRPAFVNRRNGIKI